ncbi:MAG: PorV/PorQ family protein [Candidatus Eisenbacteria bacterium]|nr:PorV/PorQ family protein [Candidatus Eisenbacteria bacterium]
MICKRHAILCCALAVAAPLPRPAAASPAGFAFLEVPAGARASALGGAYASVAQGVDAAFWNPAALEAAKGVQVTGTHYEFFEKLRHDQFAVAGRMLGGGVGLSLRALYSEPIDERDENGTLVGTFGSHDLEFAFGYGRRVAPGVSLGGSTLLVRERIANSAAMTYAFGLGGIWEPAGVSGLRLSLSAHDLGPAATYTVDGAPGAPVPLPAAVQAGGSYGLGVGTGLTLRGALEGRFTRGRSGVAMLGGELSGLAGAALRAGLRFNDTASSFGAGAGYALQNLRLDYAFVPYRLDLGDTHRFSFSAQF